ncbi:MAG: cupin domain-containing protein [Chloroflexota bacterium]
MIHAKSDDQPKGWYFGPWDSSVPAAIGYANEGINLVHYHEKMFEVYLVAQGSSIIEIDGARIQLNQGDAIAVEPGEVHTFLESSADYFHFVVQTPFIKGDKVTL